MQRYLADLEQTNYLGAPQGASEVTNRESGRQEPPPTVLAALGPKMLELAAQRTQGAHPYLAPIEHTAFAREVLGPDCLLLPELGFLLEEDPKIARALAREHTGWYLEQPNYVRNFVRLGYAESDFADGGSDRLVDALIVWGGPEEVAQRVSAHLEAGADHVLVQPLNTDRHIAFDDLETLGGALPGRE
jgi:probable F420-dependent oxidoreductase